MYVCICERICMHASMYVFANDIGCSPAELTGDFPFEKCNFRSSATHLILYKVSIERQIDGTSSSNRKC